MSSEKNVWKKIRARKVRPCTSKGNNKWTEFIMTCLLNLFSCQLILQQFSGALFHASVVEMLNSVHELSKFLSDKWNHLHIFHPFMLGGIFMHREIWPISLKRPIALLTIVGFIFFLIHFQSNTIIPCFYSLKPSFVFCHYCLSCQMVQKAWQLWRITLLSYVFYLLSNIFSSFVTTLKWICFN